MRYIKYIIPIVLLLLLFRTELTTKAAGNSANMVQKIDYRIISDNFNILLTAGENQLLLYKQAENAFKPYVKELYTPGGVNVLLDSPDDHKHHHGLMFACRVDGINFWEETATSGFQISSDYKEVMNINAAGGFVTNISWRKERDGEPMLSEIRSIRGQYLADAQTNLFTWESSFMPPEDKASVILSGAHYNGLGLRFVRSMDITGTFHSAENKEGEIFRGEERLIPDRWCAYTAKAGDREVTVAMFNAPENPRSPATWFTMKKPFAYMAATLKLHEDPWTLEKGDILSLKYGIAVWDGKIDNQQIEEVYQYWIKNL